MNAMPPPATAAVESLRARLWDANFRPVPLYNWDTNWLPFKERGKRPKGDKWELCARRDPPEAVDARPELDALNTGILCDGLRVIDCDVDGAELVGKLRALAVAIFGETLIRTRPNSPRCALVYRAAKGQPDKRVIAGTAGKIEILGRGQQLHAFGPHPTGAALHWHPEAPGDATRDNLPAVTEAQVDAFLAAAAPLVGAKPPAPKQPSGIRAQFQNDPAADPLDVAAALAVIPNDGPPDWEAWNSVGMATWAATGGAESGFAAWCAWSERHPTHDPAACRERWQHFPESPPNQTGAGKLFKLAYEARPGWRKPSGGHAPPQPAGPPAMAILARSACPAPALPLDAFGPFWSDWIERAAEGANAPPDYVAMPLLALASSLLGNARWVVGWHGWAEPPALWCASVGNPSSGKSSGAGPVTRDVLGAVEKHISKDYPAEAEKWEEIASVSRAVLKQWEKDTAQAIKGKKPVPEKPREAIIPPKPIRPRARVADVTTEKLASILEAQPKGVLYVRDELAGWLMNLSRYANGGSDRPFWLEAYVGGAMQVDRVKNPDPVFIPHLTVPVFGTIQPDRLADTLDGADDGLASRFLWSWPEARPFRRPEGAGDIDAAANRLLTLAGLQMAKDAEGNFLPSYVHLAADATDVLESFGREMQRRETTAPGLLKSSLGKARGQALRLALVLEFLRWAGDGVNSSVPGVVPIKLEPVAVSRRAMQDAAGLMTSYFLPMASRVLGDAAIPTEERDARTLATWIMETRPERVNVSMIRDEARLPGLRETDPVKAACRHLAESRWLTEAALSGERGRPRGDYMVNPKLWESPAPAAPAPDDDEVVL